MAKPPPAPPATEPYDNGFRFTLPINATPGEIKASLFEHHKLADTMDTFYHLYPESRPKGRGDDRPAGRGR